MQSREHAHRVAASLTGAVLLLVGGVFLVQVFVVALGASVVPSLRPVYRLSADFPDAAGLRVGHQVLVNGAVVGQVRSVALRDGHARVDMEFDEGQAPVHRDVTAAITPTSAVGHSVVDLRDPGAGPLLPSGGSIGLARTVSPVSLDDVLSALTADPRAGLRTIVREMGGSVDGRGADLRAVTAGTQAMLAGLLPLSRQLGADQDRIAAILDHSHAVVGQLAGSRLDDLIGDAGRVGEEISAQEPRLGPTLDAAIADLAAANATFSGNEASALAALDRLPPALRQLDRTLTDVRPPVEDALLPEQADVLQLIVELRDGFGRTTADGLAYWKVQLGLGQRSLLGGPAGSEAPGAAAPPGGAHPAGSAAGGDSLLSILLGN
jgi:phospholipid/cholesterol/gamma-HCH transport system substrate-binding protein